MALNGRVQRSAGWPREGVGLVLVQEGGERAHLASARRGSNNSCLGSCLEAEDAGLQGALCARFARRGSNNSRGQLP